MMQSPIVTPHSRLLAQQNDELTKLAATYREALEEAREALADPGLADFHVRVVCLDVVKAVLS